MGLRSDDNPTDANTHDRAKAMTDEQKAAYANAMAACAMVKAMGMQADNEQAKLKGFTILPWRGVDFDKVLDEYGTHHNSLMCLFHV